MAQGGTGHGDGEPHGDTGQRPRRWLRMTRRRRPRIRAVTFPVLENDTDADGDTLLISGFTQPAHGAVVKNADGDPLPIRRTLTIMARDSFTYTISDGKGGTDTATVSLTVTPVNDAPVALDDVATTPRGTRR